MANRKMSILIEVRKAVAEIKPGEKRKILVQGYPSHDWDTLDKLQPRRRDPVLPSDIFLTLRFTGDSNDKNVMVDIYRLA